jgi:hypothetical protein
MKVVLEEASPWPVDVVTSLGRVADARTRAESGQDAQLEVLIGPLEPLRELWLPWKTQSLSWGLPPGGKFEIIKESQEKSALDWPIDVIDSLVMDEAGKVLEARVTLLYFMLEWCAWVSVRGRPEQLDAERDRALQVVKSARPDWTRIEVAAIAQLYE